MSGSSQSQHWDWEHSGRGRSDREKLQDGAIRGLLVATCPDSLKDTVIYPGLAMYRACSGMGDVLALEVAATAVQEVQVEAITRFASRSVLFCAFGE